MNNALVRKVSFRIGPLVLETLVKHYFERITKETPSGNLRQEDILYDEAFNIIKAFLAAASQHSVEDVQSFSNTRTPSPPWVHVVRLVVPMASCDEAATYLIQALGGEDVTRRTVGGIKWWQVRGLNGVDAQWITAQKDWKELKKRHKMHDRSKAHPVAESAADYEEQMDEMRCILYAHGGGYYFGSVDQERYSIQRHARKINGRVFAVNYRLAPQYPFPCAIQDMIAAYLYLIRPPSDAKHQPVSPSHITLAGDSAGGGLTIALLQVIRDVGLPMPAGAILISPWCDLTHSFPSIHLNTTTDIIPPHGLSLQKPSSLWPPPSDEMTSRVHASLRSRIRQTFRLEGRDSDPAATILSEAQMSAPPTPKLPVNVGFSANVPTQDDQTISLIPESGEILSIDQQVHLYVQNSLLVHPLVSPAVSYLGGLPPLLIIAGDKEVLRDEVIYLAHKAAYPDRFSVREEARALYPALNGIESRFKATPVHLQVYDDAPHVLPVLFSFSTPAKYCHRAIASFCKHVTPMKVPVEPSSTQEPLRKRLSIGNILSPRRAATISVHGRSLYAEPVPMSPTSPVDIKRSSVETPSSPTGSGRFNTRRTVSVANVLKKRRSTLSAPSDQVSLPSTGSSSNIAPETDPEPPIERYAGDPVVYSGTPEFPSMEKGMIRERVSIHGVVRPLEPESELDAMQVPHEMIGSLSELVIRRYLDARSKFDIKFASTIKSIEKHRRNALEREKKEALKNLATRNPDNPEDSVEKVRDSLIPSSGWAWALDGERPPPSSIASRRDTSEARRLAKIADQDVLQNDGVHAMSGNNLWSILVSSLSVAQHEKTKAHDSPENTSAPKRKSTFSRFLSPKGEESSHA
ncbi:Alpha/Beta hydrolase protein [Mycena floridula]|nr:Alpha/Beta hydrolase protein [Mycena floridula]